MKDKTISEILDELKELIHKYEEEIEMAYESDPLSEFLDGNEPRGARTKAIMIIDMPKCCSECPCFYHYNCIPAKRELGIATSQMGIPIDFCPLKPLPQKKVFAEGLNEFQKGTKRGWNDCINEITGE